MAPLAAAACSGPRSNSSNMPGDGRMVDRLAVVVGQQILLADISDVGAFRILGEQMVEGLVLGRADVLGDRLIPFLASWRRPDRRRRSRRGNRTCGGAPPRRSRSGRGRPAGALGEPPSSERNVVGLGHAAICRGARRAQRQAKPSPLGHAWQGRGPALERAAHRPGRPASGPCLTCGEVPEWSIGAVSKTVERASVPRVRIPPSPPFPCSLGAVGGRSGVNLLSRNVGQVVRGEPLSFASIRNMILAGVLWLIFLAAAAAYLISYL